MPRGDASQAAQGSRQILGANTTMRRAWLGPRHGARSRCGGRAAGVQGRARPPPQWHDRRRAGGDARQHREPRRGNAGSTRHRRTDPRQWTACRWAVLRPVRDDGGHARQQLPVRHAGYHEAGLFV